VIQKARIRRAPESAAQADVKRSLTWALRVGATLAAGPGDSLHVHTRVEIPPDVSDAFERVAPRLSRRLQRASAPTPMLATLAVWWEECGSWLTPDQRIAIAARTFERRECGSARRSVHLLSLADVLVTSPTLPSP
jgi:hypothetical protein